MPAYNNFYVQQLLESRGTKLPDLDYLSYGEPTTYGTTYVYNEEVARSLQHPRVKKGSVNRGSGGMTTAPWAETVVQSQKMVSVYGQDFVKSENVEERFNAEALVAKNKAMKKKQRAEALLRQEKLFSDSKTCFDQHMSQERERYKKAQEKYDNYQSRVFNSSGVSMRPKEDEVERFAKTLEKKLEMESRIRATVPRHISKTPQPTSSLLKTDDTINISSEMPPRAQTVLGLTTHDDGEGESGKPSLLPPLSLQTSSVFPSGSSPLGGGGRVDAASIAEKQRARHAILEEQRIAQGKEALVARGWSDETDPRGPDKRPYVPEIDDGGLGPEALSRIELAVRKRKLEDFARREANAAERANAQQRLQAQLREMTELSKKPGIHRRTQKQFSEIMGELLKDSSAKITVPKNLGIIKPIADSEITERYVKQQQQQQPQQQGEEEGNNTFSTLTGAVPLRGTVRSSTVRLGGGGSLEDDDNGEETKAAAGLKTNSRSPRGFNIINNADFDQNQNGVDNKQQKEGGEGVGVAKQPQQHNILPNQSSSPSSAVNVDVGLSPTTQPPLRKTIHTHMPLPLSQRVPMNPTRRDVDRELRTVVYGGHLIKDRSAAIKALGPEKVAYIKGLNLTAPSSNGAKASAAPRAAAASMAKPMVPPASVGKANLSLL